MMKSIPKSEDGQKVLDACSFKPLNARKTGTGIPLLQRGSINLYMNMPCPLKVVSKMVIGEFVEMYNSSHDVPVYSPMLHDGDSKGIEGELKAAKCEDELPEVLVASGLHTVLSRPFRKRFIDTGIYSGVTCPRALERMTPEYRTLVSQHNIGILGAGYWSIVCDLSMKLEVPYPRKWTDLVDPIYKGLITVHGYHGKASISSLLMVLKDRLGDDAATRFGMNIKNIWHFAEILKRIDSNDARRAPFNLLPNAATVQLPSRKDAGILEFEDGPVLAPMLMFAKTSKIEQCRPLMEFFCSNTMRQALKRGDFYLAEDVEWEKPFSFPSWNYLLCHDYEELNLKLNEELRAGLSVDVLFS